MPTLADLAAAVQRLRASTDAALGAPTLTLRELEGGTVEYGVRQTDGTATTWQAPETPEIAQLFQDFADHINP